MAAHRASLSLKPLWIWNLSAHTARGLMDVRYLANDAIGFIV